MAIDDPLDQMNDRIRAEALNDFPAKTFAPFLATFLELVPGVEIGKSAAKIAEKLIGKIEEDRCLYLIDCLTHELRRVRRQVEMLLQERGDESTFIPLLLDGLKKAEQTRDRARIERIAAILSHSLRTEGKDAADTAEEMMRIAMFLSDADVAVLDAIYRGLIRHFNKQDGRTDFERTNDFWRSYDKDRASTEFRAITLSAGDIDSSCVKLQSVGLVAQVGRVEGKISFFVTPYALLSKGVSFVEYIKGF